MSMITDIRMDAKYTEGEICGMYKTQEPFYQLAVTVMTGNLS